MICTAEECVVCNHGVHLCPYGHEKKQCDTGGPFDPSPFLVLPFRCTNLVCSTCGTSDGLGFGPAFCEWCLAN